MNSRQSRASPRLIASFVGEVASAQAGQEQRPMSGTKHSSDEAKLAARLSKVMAPLQPESAVTTITEGLALHRYRLFHREEPHQPEEWRSFNGLIGAWLESSPQRALEEAYSLVQNKVEEATANLDRLHERMKRRFAGPNKETLLQLIQDQKTCLVARGQRLLQSGEIDAAVVAAAATPTPGKPIQDCFAASGQGCFDVTDAGTWQRLADEEAAQRLQMTFVTGKIPEAGGVPASPTAPLHSSPQTAFHHLVGHALYRNRITRSVTIQLVGDKADQARRRILSIGGGYVAQLDCSALAFSRRRVNFSSTTRIVLVDLDSTSRRTATKALPRVLSLKNHPLIITTGARDQTPLVLPEGFKLLFHRASDVVDQVRHHILLPAAASGADCSKLEIPCSAEVRKSLLQRLLRDWLKKQEGHIKEADQYHRTTPLKQVTEEILHVEGATVYQSLAPTQRELSVLFEEANFPIVSHSNTLKVKLIFRRETEGQNTEGQSLSC